MTQTRLSPDIVALIHHSELNRAGWFDAYKQRAVSTLFWFENSSLSIQDVLEKQTLLGLSGLQFPETNDLLAALCESGTLIETTTAKYRLSESSYAEITQIVTAAETLERNVKDRFCLLIESDFKDYLPLDANRLWEEFRREFLVPLVDFFGARTYEILTGNTTDIDQAPFALSYLNAYTPEQRLYIRRLIETFLDPSFPDFRSYTLRLLNNHFFLIASRYRRDHLETLYGGKRRPTIRCILDTNFLYSILELHDNPSNEAAKALLETIEGAKKYIDVRLYVFPPTVDELKRSLAIHEEYLSRITVTRSMSEAVSDDAVSGVALKYFKECGAVGYTLSAKDYFDPYQNNLTQILRDKGIELFNERTDKYSSDQRVIDDALDQQSFLTQRHVARKMRGRPKSYDQIWHDVLLWYFIFDKRPAQFDSIIDADILGITIDYSLIGFDSFKRRGNIPRIPIFIHPATLIQMFQFFVPLDKKFEAAIVDTLRLPFLLQEFDPESERTTVRILTRMSRFENIDDLSPTTIRSVLENELLRDNLQRVENADDEVKLIREALIEENAKTQKQLDDAKIREGEFLQHIRQLEGLSEEDKEKITELKERVDVKSEENTQLLQRLDELGDNLNSMESREEETRGRVEFVRFYVRWPLIIIAVVLLVLSLSYEITWENVAVVSFPVFTIVVAWMYVICWQGRNNVHVAKWKWFERLNAIRFRLSGVIVALYVGLTVTAYWDLIKSYPRDY